MMTSKMKQLGIGAIVLLVLIVGASIFWSSQRPVKTIGDWKIYKKDIDQRDQIIRLDFPEEKRSLGLMQLEKSATHLAILKNFGVEVSEAQIDAEQSRIDASTRNPEQLAKVKAIFGQDTQAYRKNFILPALVDRMIYFDFFVKSDKIHQESLRNAADFISSASAQPAAFQQLAASKKLKVTPVTISLKEGVQWGTPIAEGKAKRTAKPIPMKVEEKAPKNQKLMEKVQAEMAAVGSDEALQWRDNVIAHIEVGGVSPIPLNREDAWLVAHYLRQSAPGVYELEVVTFPKIEFGTWLEEQKKIIFKEEKSGTLSR